MGFGRVAALCCAGALLAGLGSAAQAASSPLVLGTVLPDTGVLAEYGPATQVAVRLAVEDANAAGGVAGSPVILEAGDSGDGVRTLSTTVERLRAEGAVALIGPLSSSLMLNGVDLVEGLAVVSPATTSPLLSGVVARVVPSDVMQGAALAKLASQAGVTRVAIVAPRASRSIADVALAGVGLRGMQGEVIDVSSRMRAADVASRVARVGADGLILLTDKETTGIIRELLRRGLPANVLLGTVAASSVDGAALPRGTLQGARGIGPDLRVQRSFAERVQAEDAKAKTMDYAALAYDAAAVAILAAEQSAKFLGEVTAEGIRGAIPSVTVGGARCDTLASCLRKVRDGVDIDYVGFSGAVDLGDTGEPIVATYAVRTFGANNAPGTRLRYVSVP